ncbi:MAG: D-alanyl-D-alanine carboxypeptidase [Bdellovibrionales bacterium]|nr:D-alanyl-D-alanine carboxypeptidase [Bdellovibrionales bacterium]
MTISCNKKSPSIYEGIPQAGEGVIAVDIPDTEGDVVDEPDLMKKDQLSLEEKELVDDLHEGEVDKLSFLVVEAESSKVMRSYLSEEPRRLASVSKIPTALAALMEVNNVEVNKVSGMLKISNNGEASRYVRLAAKAIDGLVTGSKHYPQAHSCPDEFLKDLPAAKIVQGWVFNQINIDWTNASLNDGAGCHYDNFMNSEHVVHIIDWADQQGAIYAGMSFDELLSISGVDGTWKNKNKDHKGQIFAKTGTLRPNSNLAGYFYARRDGEMKKYFFNVFIEKKGGGSYTTKARKLIESLMRHWINYYSQKKGEPIEDFNS